MDDSIDDEPVPEPVGHPTDPSGWRFDPGNPPDEWTKELIGRLTIRWLERLSKPGNGVLDEAQQTSFDEASEEWREEFSTKFQPIIESLMLRIDRPDFVSPALRQTIKKSQVDLARQLDLSKRVGVRVTYPAWDWQPPNIEPVRSPSRANETLADDLFEETSTTIEHLTILQSIADIMNTQARSAARGAVFYVVVGSATTLGGISTLISLESWIERFWALGLTLALAGIALGAYLLRAHRQRKGKAR